ncbi:helix-turn-helix transcriptional regulator [Methylotuvimicrobium sp. KM1]|uniref:helix-turn-helix transcriptional regulator n=1 Tax=Methylotuvimicrobium sp. KM1 TaxID=3377707 RepID=UPI003850DFA2
MSDKTENLTPLFLRISEVVRVTGLSATSIYRLAESSEFPKPVKLGPRASAWRYTDLIEWANTREAAE